MIERRIYRIDKLRLHPAGIPLRTIAYLVPLVAGALLVSRLPLLGAVARIAPWYLRTLLAPAALAGAFTTMRVDGRPSHLTARGLLCFAAGPRSLTALRPSCRSLGGRVRPGRLLVLADGSHSTLRRFRYRGPGAVRIAVPYTCRQTRVARWPAGGTVELVAERDDGACRRADVLLLADGARLEVRS
jgi:hypothetical protein